MLYCACRAWPLPVSVQGIKTFGKYSVYMAGIYIMCVYKIVQNILHVVDAISMSKCTLYLCGLALNGV